MAASLASSAAFCCFIAASWVAAACTAAFCSSVMFMACSMAATFPARVSRWVWSSARCWPISSMAPLIWVSPLASAASAASSWA